VAGKVPSVESRAGAGPAAQRPYDICLWSTRSMNLRSFYDSARAALDAGDLVEGLSLLEKSLTHGIDAAVVRRFGTSLMERVQHRLMDEYMGEQPVGSAFVVATGDPQLPFLVHAPTMRVPGSTAGTDKV